MQIGTKIKINKSPIETLVKVSDGFGLFENSYYKVVRKISRIQNHEMVNPLGISPTE